MGDRGDFLRFQSGLDCRIFGNRVDQIRICIIVLLLLEQSNRAVIIIGSGQDLCLRDSRPSGIQCCLLSGYFGLFPCPGLRAGAGTGYDAVCHEKDRYRKDDQEGCYACRSEHDDSLAFPFPSLTLSFRELSAMFFSVFFSHI